MVTIMLVYVLSDTAHTTQLALKLDSGHQLSRELISDIVRLMIVFSCLSFFVFYHGPRWAVAGRSVYWVLSPQSGPLFGSCAERWGVGKTAVLRDGRRRV